MGGAYSEKRFSDICNAAKSNSENYRIQKEWRETVVPKYKSLLEGLNKGGLLTFEMVKQAVLFGKGNEAEPTSEHSEKKNFIGIWEQVIEKLRTNDGGTRFTTAESYVYALRSLKRILGENAITGFNISAAEIQKWKDGMHNGVKGADGELVGKISDTTAGIYLRCCRAIWNRCVREGYLQDVPYPFSNKIEKGLVSIPKSAKRRQYFLNVEQMMTYHAIAFCAKLIFLTYAASAGRFLANLYDLVIERKRHLPFCMYYFVVFDHGLSKMAEALNGLLAHEDADTEVLTLAKQDIRMLVSHSVNMGVENKTTWQKTADKCSPDVWKEVTFLLHQMKGKGGNKKKMLSIDDILIGNKAKLKQGITAFLKENTEDISLAYLLFVLVRTRHVRESVKYMDFHRAIVQFSHKQYGSDVPQRRYGEIKEFSMKEPQRGASYQKAKAIIDEWTERFNRCE